MAAEPKEELLTAPVFKEPGRRISGLCLRADINFFAAGERHGQRECSVRATTGAGEIRPRRIIVGPLYGIGDGVAVAVELIGGRWREKGFSQKAAKIGRVRFD